MRKSSILVAVLLMCSNVLFSQTYYSNSFIDGDVTFEFGGSIGGMNCMTDLGGPKGKGGFYFGDINFSNTRLSGGAYFGVMFRNLAGVRLEAMFGSVQAADSLLKGATDFNTMKRFNRNLNFKSNISEISLLAEFYPLGLFNNGDEPSRFSPYVASGFGWYSFNPRADVNGKNVYLRQLRLEGQGFTVFPDTRQYRTSQINIPVGVGIKYEISDLFNVRLEFLHRILFTDHLDDVGGNYIDPSLFSQQLPEPKAALAKEVYALSKSPIPIGEPRGNSKNNDSYMNFTLKLGVKLGR